MKHYEKLHLIVNRYYKYVFGIISLNTILFIVCFNIFASTRVAFIQSDKLTYTSTATNLNNSAASIKYSVTETWRNNQDGSGEFEEQNTKCHIPKLIPFDESILPYWQNSESIDCTDEFPLLFAKDFDSNLHLVNNPKRYGYFNCSYNYLIRKNDSDNSVVLSEETYRITETSTKILPNHEFISVSCFTRNTSKIIDMFPYVPLRFNQMKLNHQNKGKHFTKKARQIFNGPTSKYNYVILGMDALSHMNFIRSMPNSYKFITEELNYFVMNGYTKIGGNTYPNIVGVLMGKNETEVKESCLNSTRVGSGFYDDCPFIWKNFSEQGYTTSYYEDAPWMGIFNYGKKGFRNHPTDYYGRPFTHLADNTIGSKRLLNANLCNGPRLSFDILHEYVQQMAITMQRNMQNYFQFAWTTSLTHDYLNKGMLGDKMLLNTLKMFSDRKYLENTVLILTSDHGALWGGIRNTHQGKIEERMPLLYFIIPEKILKNPLYQIALKNLKVNSKRLTSPFDFHETLKDFLNISNLENDLIKHRTVQLSQMKNLPRGISLFLPIPADRDCKQAGIGEHFCVCNSMKNISVENNTDVSEAAEKVVVTINHILQNGDHASNCANLALKSVITAEEMELIEPTDHEQTKKDADNDANMILTVNFVTNPGNASFEAMVKRYGSLKRWKVLGEISRTNLYGNQSHCTQKYELKKYCYCLY